MSQRRTTDVVSSRQRTESGALLFVYGTLRRGFENHQAYLADAPFVGKALTRNKFALFLDDFPYLLKNPAVSCIVGEIYQVDEATLLHIDCLEGHPDDYQRELTAVLTEQGEAHSAWVYFYPEPRGNLVVSGDYLSVVSAATTVGDR
jgi:gamma-glutamylaminecyclotransferase